MPDKCTYPQPYLFGFTLVWLKPKPNFSNVWREESQKKVIVCGRDGWGILVSDRPHEKSILFQVVIVAAHIRKSREHVLSMSIKEHGIFLWRVELAIFPHIRDFGHTCTRNIALCYTGARISLLLRLLLKITEKSKVFNWTIYMTCSIREVLFYLLKLLSHMILKKSKF